MNMNDEFWLQNKFNKENESTATYVCQITNTFQINTLDQISNILTIG